MILHIGNEQTSAVLAACRYKIEKLQDVIRSGETKRPWVTPEQLIECKKEVDLLNEFIKTCE